MLKLYVQYGCGLSAPEQWVNFDVSPTLRLLRLPIIGKISKGLLKIFLASNVQYGFFPDNVRYGDIIKGLPIADNSVDGLYCSHTLEHLALEDFRKSLVNSYKVLKKGGIFRCIVPDLEQPARQYINELDNGTNKLASVKFIGNNTLLGVTNRQRGLKGILTAAFGSHHHLWMWDKASLAEELRQAGFIDIRTCDFNDCEDEMFKYVEAENRFRGAVAIECRK